MKKRIKNKIASLFAYRLQIIKKMFHIINRLQDMHCSARVQSSLRKGFDVPGFLFYSFHPTEVL